jgi:energy-coupling factor transporter transmembrane protein EcfT
VNRNEKLKLFYYSVFLTLIPVGIVAFIINLEFNENYSGHGWQLILFLLFVLIGLVGILILKKNFKLKFRLKLLLPFLAFSLVFIGIFLLVPAKYTYYTFNLVYGQQGEGPNDYGSICPPPNAPPGAEYGCPNNPSYPINIKTHEKTSSYFSLMRNGGFNDTYNYYFGALSNGAKDTALIIATIIGIGNWILIFKRAGPGDLKRKT